MKKSRAAWMRDGKFGMMVHWVPKGIPPRYGRQVKDIDKAVGGGVTFNIGIFQEGVVGSATVERLAELAKRLSK